MTTDEVMSIAVGIIMVVAVFITLAVVVVMSVSDYLKRTREKENYRECERRELVSCIHHIERDLYNINETLKKKENEDYEED